jgi:hypothetical protein
MATLAEARAAKEKLALSILDLPELCGLGVAVLGKRGFGIKVNLTSAPSAFIPPDVDGVPVIVEVVGEIQAE